MTDEQLPTPLPEAQPEPEQIPPELLQLIQAAQSKGGLGTVQIVSMLLPHLPAVATAFAEHQKQRQLMRKINRALYLAVVLVILGAVVWLSLAKVIESSTVGTILGAIVGYTLGAVKEGFYD